MNVHVVPGLTLTQPEAVDVKSAEPVCTLPNVRMALPVLEISTCASSPFAKVCVDELTVTLPNARETGEIPAIGTAEIVAVFDHPESSAEVGL